MNAGATLGNPSNGLPRALAFPQAAPPSSTPVLLQELLQASLIRSQEWEVLTAAEREEFGSLGDPQQMLL